MSQPHATLHDEYAPSPIAVEDCPICDLTEADGCPACDATGALVIKVADGPPFSGTD
jgi:hypothetical protein